MKTIFFALLMIMTFAGQSQQGYYERLNRLFDGTVPYITAEQLSNRINGGEAIYLLDTRAREEYKVSHIENALRVGFEDFDVKKVKGIPKESPVVVYCSIGVRSESVGEQLIDNGFERVYNLYGGLFEWYYRSFVIVDKNGDSTTKIHTYDKNWASWLRRGTAVY